jgi:NADPH:quinone reductase-like Zn-dependent oxidoreductase
MRAAVMTKIGGPEVFERVDLPEPEIVDDKDVRMRLRAAGVNL